MIDKLSLNEPTKEGVFDPLTRVVRVPSGSKEVVRLFNSIASNSPNFIYPEWKNVHNMVHEALHFYQFSTTAFGWLYTLLSVSQIAAVHFFLLELASLGKKVVIELPLVYASNTRLRQFEGNLLSSWSLIVLAETLKRTLLPSLSDGLELKDRMPHLSSFEIKLANKYAREMVGWSLPVIESQSMRFDHVNFDEKYARLYGMRGLLESHAEGWASAQVIFMLDNQDWSESEKALAARDLAKMRRGPYDTPKTLIPHINVHPSQFFKTTCLFADLAMMSSELLKPFLVTSIDDTQSIRIDCLKIYSSIMASFEKGLLASPPASSRPEHDDYEWLISVATEKQTRPASLTSISSIIADDVLRRIGGKLSEQLGDLTPLSIWCSDVLFACHEGAVLRRRWPMLLTGDQNEFQLCIQAIGFPSVLSSKRSGVISNIRELRGHYRYSDQESDSLLKISVWVHNEVIPLLELFRLLLYSDKDELERHMNIQVLPDWSSPTAKLKTYDLDLASFS
jgi:hypothetical protein